MKNLSLALLLVALLSLAASRLVLAQSTDQPTDEPSEASATTRHTILLPLIMQSANNETASISTLLADGQFVYGPNVGDFDVERYLAETQSPLLPHASVIYDKATYYSVNPRLILTLLEMTVAQSVVVDGSTAAPPTIEREQLSAHLERMLVELTRHFYGQLYGRNLAVQSSAAYLAPVAVTVASGETTRFESTGNAASDAILVTLAPYLTQDDWQQISAAGTSGSFIDTYRQLFPDSDPLDESNRIQPNQAPPDGVIQAAAAPATLLKFPFAEGDSWRYTGGPHAFNGCTDNVFSAVDFAPLGYSGCSDPVAEDRWITSPAAGTVSAVSCGGCNVAVEHGNGWGTRVYHVVNPQVTKGQKIATDTRLGNPSCAPVGVSCGSCGGGSTGVHQHIDLRFNGAFVAIDGTAFEGWKIQAGDACYQGKLEKNGKVLGTGGRVTSTVSSSLPVIDTSVSGTLGLNNWYVSPVSLTVTAIDAKSTITEVQWRVAKAGSLTIPTWQMQKGSAVTIMLDSEGVYTVTVKAQNKLGLWSEEESTGVRIDWFAAQGNLQIARGAEIATSPLVTISALVSDSVSGVTHLRLRNVGTEWSDWMTHTAEMRWKLTGFNGQTSTVEAQLRDAAGHISQVLSDSIVLNSQMAQATSTRYRLVRSTLASTVGGGTSPIFIVNGILAQSAGTETANSAHYRLATGYWRNDSPADALPAPTRTPSPNRPTPAPTSLPPGLPGDCLLTINNDTDFTKQKSVQIKLGVVGAKEMLLSTAEVFTSTVWQPYTTTAILTLPSAVNQIRRFEVNARFRANSVYLCGGAVIAGEIVYDPLPPTVSLQLDGSVDRSNPNTEQAVLKTVQIQAVDQVGGSGVADMQLSSSNDFSATAWQPYTTTVSLSLDNRNLIFVRVRDKAGNLSQTAGMGYQIFLPVIRKR